MMTANLLILDLSMYNRTFGSLYSMSSKILTGVESVLRGVKIRILEWSIDSVAVKIHLTGNIAPLGTVYSQLLNNFVRIANSNSTPISILES